VGELRDDHLRERHDPIEHLDPRLQPRDERHVLGQRHDQLVVNIPISAMFGGCTTSATRTFFFFDTTTNPDNSSTFTQYWVLTAQLNASPPTAPVITPGLAGDEAIQISWNSSAFTTLGTMGQVYVYAAAGCAGDGGVAPLTAGVAPPASHIHMTSASSPISLDTSLLHWSPGTYGEQASIGIAVIDSAGNLSNLSNVECATHVHVSGFWDQYCAEHGMTDTAACAGSYRGCSVALPGRREDLGAWIIGFVVLGLFAARRRRRAR